MHFSPCRAVALAKADALCSLSAGGRTRRGELAADNRIAAHARAAFTLIELTVVILIIATLTALFVGAAANTFERARKTQAKNDVTQLVTAINAFYTEYGKYPVPSSDW